MALGFDAWMLGLEASTVVGLRTLKLAAGGDAAAAEASRMISEKLTAAVELQALATAGALGVTAPRAVAKTLTHYRRKVRANRRRLSKG
jgi:hypothetical protein